MTESPNYPSLRCLWHLSVLSPAQRSAACSLHSGEHEQKLTSSSADGSSLWLKSVAQFFCLLMKRNETREPSSIWQGRDTARRRLIMWLLHDTWGGRMRPCEYFGGWQERVVMMELSTPSVVYPLELSMQFRESFHKFLQVRALSLNLLKVPTDTFTIRNLLWVYPIGTLPQSPQS